MEKNLNAFLGELKKKATNFGASYATIVDTDSECGWEIQPITKDTDPGSVTGGILAGLVLVGD